MLISRSVHRLLLPACLAALIGAGACASSSSPTAPGSSGTLTVMLKDSPFSSAKAFLVTFSGVAAHSTGGAFDSLAFSPVSATRTCDLTRLQSTTDVLGTGALPAGHYTQLRLTLVGATLYFDAASVGPACASSMTPPAGASATVTVPSGTVYLNRQFDVTAGQTTTITLDFNGDQSVHQEGTGSYTMTPVITVVSVQ